jgi:hypothetical protein
VHRPTPLQIQRGFLSPNLTPKSQLTKQWLQFLCRTSSLLAWLLGWVTLELWACAIKNLSSRALLGLLCLSFALLLFWSHSISGISHLLSPKTHTMLRSLAVLFQYYKFVLAVCCFKAWLNMFRLYLEVHSTQDQLHSSA